MKKLTFFTIALWVTTSGFSQSDLRKGFIITNAKDTIFGLVDYREGPKAYKSCSFKKTEAQNITIYEPNELSGYGFVAGKFFESREIKDENSRKVAFIEVKIKGIVSMYKFDYSFFVAKTGDTLTRLYNNVVEKRIDGKLVQWNTNEHVVTLNWLLFDCSELRERIQKVRLIERDLTSLIEDYNSCKGKPTVTYNATKPWIKLGIGITGGLNISRLEFVTANSKFGHLQGSSDVLKSPVIGLSFDVVSPRLSERFSFHGDILYIKSKYQHNNVLTSYYSTERNYVTIELDQVKIPLGARYTFPERKFTSYLNVGISATLNLNSKSTWLQESEGHFNDVFITQDNGEALPIKYSQLGFWGGFGVMKSVSKKFRAFAEVRYEQTNGVSYMSHRAEDLRSKIQNFQISLGIRK